MPRITFVEHNGTEHCVDLPLGTSLMEGAVNHMIPGIEGDCGGLCACATCHVYIEETWQTHCDLPEELEMSILDFAFDVDQSSRLACQITVAERHEGMTVRLPKRQY